MQPVFGDNGGDLVPLALIDNMNLKDIRPKWLNLLPDTFPQLIDSKWGRYDRPIFFTSSNYGVDSLFAYGNDEKSGRKKFATTHGIINEIRRLFGWGNNFSIISHACVSGGIGLDLAKKSLSDSNIMEALVFSFDFVSPFVAGGFHSLKILNDQMPAPFSEKETGSISLGDGTAYCILSREETPYQFRSSHLFNEMDSFTGNHSSGFGFESVLLPVQKSTSDRLWIKGHGTGTLDAGRLECQSCQNIFPDAPLVSWKAGIGHTLGSCAVVELAIALESIKSGQIPGTTNSTSPTMSPNVYQNNFSANSYQEVLMLSNAFGGAHSAQLIRYE
jgi:hypothetical protein